ncbi:unnamed protein product [Auanema sp. JU1783]|nr:unnamed protein product [Auanema sp. JU1783]
MEVSNSPWSSPLVVVVKKDKNLRFCIDYCEVNKKLVLDAYPLPTMDAILHDLGKKQWFSTLDLKSGFWQVPLSEESKPITASSTPDGLFQFTVLPFGLATSPGVFQRSISMLFKNMRCKQNVHIYLDDLIVATEDLPAHIRTLEEVFETAQKALLKLNAVKSRLFQKSVTFLGHIISKDGIATCPDKTMSIEAYPEPTNISDLRTFLGMSSYYRKFVHKFDSIAKPLYELTSPKTPWVGTNG